MRRTVNGNSMPTIREWLHQTDSARPPVVLLDLSADRVEEPCTCRDRSGAERKGSPASPNELDSDESLPSRYRIERLLREGSVASVFLAHDTRLDRRVAIKVLRQESASSCNLTRFQAEVRMAARLQHPHLLSVIDSGVSDGLPYFVMPYIAGKALSDRLLLEGQLPLDDAVRIAAQVANALDYVHRQGVVHRDIKPDNIMLHEGSALISDLGIALSATAIGDGESQEGGQGGRLTEQGVCVGTPQYMSPEQALGEAAIDGRSDIYSLGCVLYEMLTGAPPFAGPTCQFSIAKTVMEVPVAPRALRDTIPCSTEEVVLKALAKVPADRFQTAGEFSRALAASTNSAKWAGKTAKRARIDDRLRPS